MHPILFNIGDFFVGTYGIMIVAGLFAGLGLAIHLGKREGVHSDHFFDLAFAAVLSGFIGARILFIAVEFEQFKEAPLAMLLAREGFVFVGGFALAAAVVAVMVARRKLPYWQMGDIAGPSVALGHAFGRIGCFLAGCCYGKVCEGHSAFCVQFPRVLDAQGETRLSFAYMDHLHRGLIPETAMASAPVMPVQLFESGANFAIAGLLTFLYSRRRFPGEIFAFYLILYGAARFALEFMRGDSGRGIYPILGISFSTSQLFSMASIAAGAIIWFRLRGRAAAPEGKSARRARKA